MTCRGGCRPCRKGPNFFNFYPSRHFSLEASRWGGWSLSSRAWLLNEPPGQGNTSLEPEGTLSRSRQRGLCMEVSSDKTSLFRKTLQERKQPKESKVTISILNMESTLKLISAWQQHTRGVFGDIGIYLYNIQNNRIRLMNYNKKIHEFKNLHVHHFYQLQSPF